eukprot:1138290-Pelagomonas_calceolata.AAC.5
MQVQKAYQVISLLIKQGNKGYVCCNSAVPSSHCRPLPTPPSAFTSKASPEDTSGAQPAD